MIFLYCISVSVHWLSLRLSLLAFLWVCLFLWLAVFPFVCPPVYLSNSQPPGTPEVHSNSTQHSLQHQSVWAKLL